MRHNLASLSCPICKSSDYKQFPYYNLEYPSVNQFFDMKLCVCDVCGFGYVLPQPTFDEMSKFYSESYHNLTSSRKANINTLSKYSYNPRAISQLLLIKQFLQIHKTEYKVLEIGPGPGNIFKTAELIGLNWDYYAIEPDHIFSKYLKAMGANIINASFSGKLDYNIQFDIIIISHVLEHFNFLDTITCHYCPVISPIFSVG